MIFSRTQNLKKGAQRGELSGHRGFLLLAVVEPAHEFADDAMVHFGERHGLFARRSEKFVEKIQIVAITADRSGRCIPLVQQVLHEMFDVLFHVGRFGRYQDYKPAELTWRFMFAKVLYESANMYLHPSKSDPAREVQARFVQRSVRHVWFPKPRR